VPFALRPATQDDEDFAWQIFKLTMQESIASMWGTWDDVRWNTFFRRHYDPSLTRIIVVDGRDVGILRVEERTTEVWLDTVEIAPEQQGRGLGSTIVRAVLADARSRNRPVGLQVNRANRARLLYERLGFIEVGSTDTHHLMRAEPDAGCN